MSEEYITSGEFGRWRGDFQAFQERLEERLNEGFHGINHRLDELNGRTRRNSESIVALDSRVENIRHSGCARLHYHEKALALGATPPTARWKDKRLWVGGGVGAAIITTIYEGVRALQQLAAK